MEGTGAGVGAGVGTGGGAGAGVEAGWIEGVAGGGPLRMVYLAVTRLGVLPVSSHTDVNNEH